MMPRGLPHARLWLCLLGGPLASWGASVPSSGGPLAPSSAAAPEDPAAALERAVSAAESSLREGERETAESRYRSALLEGWLLMGELEAAEGRLAEARDAFRRASSSAVDTRRALKSLALVHLRMGTPSDAVALLTRALVSSPRDVETRRLLAEAMVASGRPEEAVQELEEAHALAPNELELTFTLAGGYLRLKKVEAAERLFAQIVKARPIPQTRVLIGRAFHDAWEDDRARTELQAALRQDPRVRHAHYYLGMMAATAEGAPRLEEAIGEFKQELTLAPDDVMANLRLGLALVLAHRPAEALPFLERAAHSAPPPADALHFLGRCELALDHPQKAAAALQRALDLARDQGGSASQLGSIHYQLGLALRKLGELSNAATHFTEAERYSAERTDTDRDRMARYLGRQLVDAPGSELAGPPAASWSGSSPLSQLTPAERGKLRRRFAAALARSYLNLGVMQAQSERFTRAAELFESAAEVDPDFPKVQYSMGVAYFNAQRFDKALAPLARAFSATPQDAGLKRMLAMAWLNTEGYERAAELLQDDAERNGNPSLQYAYGLALVRSGRAAEAESIFSRLLREHGESADLSVVLGQAHAQQGDYDSAIRSLERALQLRADVAEANATLGVIYLKQGRLAEAEQALRAELKAHPSDLKSGHNLATVLELESRPEEALTLLRSLLKSKPDFAGARYLLGKILLAQGTATEAVEHLEAASRLAPEDANIHYQLGQAYQKLGRTELAQQEFEVFRQLKDKRRGGLS